MPNTPAFSEDYLNANKGPQVLAIIIVFPCLALITVTLRLYTRFKIVNNPSYEDFAILLALVRRVLGVQYLLLMNGHRYLVLRHQYVKASVSVYPILSTSSTHMTHRGIQWYGSARPSFDF